MNSTEQKIREAFEKHKKDSAYKNPKFSTFNAGYLSLLNGLEQQCHLVSFNAKLGGANVTDKLTVWRKEEATNQVAEHLIQKVEPLYRLPEGIDKS